MNLSTAILAAVLVSLTGCATAPAPVLKTSDPRHLTVCVQGELRMMNEKRFESNLDRTAKTEWKEELVLGEKYRVVDADRKQGEDVFTVEANTRRHIFFVSQETGVVSTEVESVRPGIVYQRTTAVLKARCGESTATK